MLSKQPWIRLAPDMAIAWKQHFDEGKDVQDLKTACEKVLSEEDAEKLYVEMSARPQRKDYRFTEPSDYESLFGNKKTENHASKVSYDKIKGAWVGRMAGCLLGKPVEGWLRSDIDKLLKSTGNYPLSKHFSKVDYKKDSFPFPKAFDTFCFADGDEIMPGDDDTNYTVLSLRLLEIYGADFTPEDAIECWLQRMPYLCACTAERVAYKNAAAGMKVPDTATYKNPYREWIGAQIRTDFYGYICGGRPVKAAELAYRDACISHTKNGIYGAMGVAAMIAEAAVSNDIPHIIRTGLDVIPNTSRLFAETENLLSEFESGKTFDELLGGIFEKYPPSEAVHTIPNYLIVVLSLLFGEKDLGKSFCLAVGAGYDTDCNGATVGSVVGALCGFGGIDPKWYTVFKCTTRTGVCDAPVIDADEFTRRTVAIAEKIK